MRSERLVHLKSEGHELIDQLVLLSPRKIATGREKRERIYEKLRDRLQCTPGNEHFASIRTIAEAERAVICLRKMLHERRCQIAEIERAKFKKDNPTKIGKTQQRKHNTLGWEEQKAAYAELRRRREEKPVSWIARIKSLWREIA